MFKVHRNDETGLQIELDGALITLRPNEHHGLSGNLCVKKDGVMRLVAFHGKHPEMTFPLEVHDVEEKR